MRGGPLDVNDGKRDESRGPDQFGARAAHDEGGARG
jgi:hypothetical protein